MKRSPLSRPRERSSKLVQTMLSDRAVLADSARFSVSCRSSSVVVGRRRSSSVLVRSCLRYPRRGPVRGVPSRAAGVHFPRTRERASSSTARPANGSAARSRRRTAGSSSSIDACCRTRAVGAGRPLRRRSRVTVRASPPRRYRRKPRRVPAGREPIALKRESGEKPKAAEEKTEQARMSLNSPLSAGSCEYCSGP